LDIFFGHCQKVFAFFKVNLCANETCSGNGICMVNHQNDTTYCRCFGINAFVGDKCQNKTSATIFREKVMTVSSYIAISFLASIWLLCIAIDCHNYFVLKKPLFGPWKKAKRPISNRNITEPKPKASEQNLKKSEPEKKWRPKNDNKKKKKKKTNRSKLGNKIKKVTFESETFNQAVAQNEPVILKYIP
jgi:hypothetical protein